MARLDTTARIGAPTASTAATSGSLHVPGVLPPSGSAGSTASMTGDTISRIAPLGVRGRARPGSRRRIHHPPHEEQGASGPILQEEQERPVDVEYPDVGRHRGGADDHRGG